MPNPTFGMTIKRVTDEARQAITGDLSIIGIIGTAEGATAAFPLDTPVLIFSNDVDALTALGTTGTLADAVRLINAQLGEFQSAAKIIIVRVAEGADADATIVNIVGDGITTGLSAFLEAPSITAHTPRLLAAPGFTSQRAGTNANAVCAALPPICAKLLAHAVVDGPSTTLQEALDWRQTISSDRIIPIEPSVKVLSGGVVVVQPLSPAVLGVGVRRDFEKGGLPFHSWANQAIYGVVGPSRPIRFSLTDGATEGQALLEANMGILIRGELGVDGGIADGGFVFIGTDNAGDDPLWRFYNVTRGRDFIHIMLLKSLRFYLGKFNITRQAVQAVLNTMDQGLRDLKAENAILGFDVGFSGDLNSADGIRNGKITVSFEAEEAPVLRQMDIRSGRSVVAIEQLIADLAS